MYTLPPTLIVTDRGHFVAYRLHPDSGPEVIDHATFTEGVEKISEQVTDKEGSFQSGGNGVGKVHASAERLHLEAELEQRCVRQIGERIQSVLTQYGGVWGFAAPSAINGAILDQLPRELVDRLRINLAKDLARVPSHQVPDHFLKARAHV